MEENIIITKLCKKCGTEKPLSEFRKQSTTKDGLQYHCKICGSKIAKNRYEKSRKKIIKKVKVWQENNQEKIKGYKTDYYLRNKPPKLAKDIIKEELNKLQDELEQGIK